MFIEITYAIQMACVMDHAYDVQRQQQLMDVYARVTGESKSR